MLKSAARVPSRALSSALGSIGTNKFDEHAFRAACGDACYEAYTAAANSGEELAKPHREAFAKGLFEWASARGATQFSHIFYPNRQMASGQKSDAFIDLDFSSAKPLKDITVGLDESRIWMGESDGSSFPNGGLRATHTAAGYLVYDRSSPPYIHDDSLMLPSSFIAWTGNALDCKTPLLRSQEAVSKQAVRLLQHLGFDEVNKVYANVGWEQEYFAIPRELVAERPDLLQCERTILGADAPKGQRLDEHYFGRIYPRVKAFNADLQAAAWEIGVPSLVYHNEVAPAQHEFSPIFSVTNVSADQNIACVEIMKEVALKHDLHILCHEKPFAGINGSGKHCNWGLNADNGMNLYTSGKTPEAQSSFIAFTAALMYGVKEYPEMYRACVAGAGNDWRLGAAEAPPAIMSMYTGPDFEAHLQSVIDGGELPGYTGGRYGAKPVDSGATATGVFGAASEDRNRTAPLPFCGNRFEFRAVSSNHNIAFPMTVMNTTAAAGLAEVADRIEAGDSVRDAVAGVLQESIKVVFNGNGYSSEWHHEAEHVRGLPNLTDSRHAFKAMNTDKNVDLFHKHGVYNPTELEALTEVHIERYITDIQLEAEVMVNMLNTAILPACAADLNAYGDSGLAGPRPAAYAAVAEHAAKVADVVANWPEGHAGLDYAADVAKPAMAAAREAHDVAEGLIDAEKYPFPTYSDMLFPHANEASFH